MDDAVLVRVVASAHGSVNVDGLWEAARRAGIPEGGLSVDRAARVILAAASRGIYPMPGLRRRLQNVVEGAGSEDSRWLTASLGERGAALRLLLLLVDALPARPHPPLQAPLAVADEPSLPEKIVQISDALTGTNVGHALGGAVALAYYATPRATDDVDINLFVTVKEHPRVQAILAPLRVKVEGATALLEREGQLRAWWGRTPVDLFYSNLPFHEAMSQSTRTVPFADREIKIVSPEHLMVCKAAFNHAQAWLDIENLLIATAVNRSEIDRWGREILGGSDERFHRLRELEARILGPDPSTGEWVD